MKTKSFVFDTNCLISALLIPLSVSRKALDKAANEGRLVFSPETLNELNEVLIRSKFDKYIPIFDRLEFASRLEAEGKTIQTQSAFEICRDIKDNKFLNVAYDSNVICIVSGDKDLLSLNPFQNIPIISPAEFLNITPI